MLPAFFLVTCLASWAFGETFTCYECQDCSLPIGKDTNVSEKTCNACQIQFKLTESGKATKVNAACQPQVCDPSYKASDTGADVVACCDSSNCNSMPGVGWTLLPSRVSLLLPFAILLYFTCFGNQ
ncbi:hypothetical protein CRM22_005388 [Opisthorchis felineus]|uniref:UPAR/Ly6 domain-containing protein n=1 Tax=Opisthorchis felineus TaxID=147828 RepID=A0A4S2LY47_OPIFE|nr:hypothetical protein CRM22_005388 [Opisthorchis felineus]